MDITLEKIELVKDRTGVTYREAKEALEAENGSVVDAIIHIEDQIDIVPKTVAENAASNIVQKLKQMVHKGNVSKILIKNGDEVVLSIPVSLGVIGAFLIPEAAVFSTIVALGVKCSISIITTDGEEIDVVQKARERFNEAKGNYSTVADGLKEKGSDAISRIREKADSVKSKAEPAEIAEEEKEEPQDEDYFNFDDDYPDPDELEDTEDKSSEGQDPSSEEEPQVPEEPENPASEDTAKDASEEIKPDEEPAEEDPEGVFESTINAFKAKRRFFKS